MRTHIIDGLKGKLTPSQIEHLTETVKAIIPIVRRIEASPPMSKHHYLEYAEQADSMPALNLMFLAGMPEESFEAVKLLKGWN